jgi:glycosidase
VASHFGDLSPLYPLYGLLMTMPGVPSIYYGSEWGIGGQRSATSDTALRPAMRLADWPRSPAQRDLAAAIGRLARLRHGCDALRRGGYRALHVAHEQLAFARETDGDGVVVVINLADQPAAVDLALPSAPGRRWIDLLDPGAGFSARAGRTRIDPVWPRWLRVLRPD